MTIAGKPFRLPHIAWRLAIAVAVCLPVLTMFGGGTGVDASDDANQAPTFGDETGIRSVDEGTAAGENIGSPIAATDADGDTLTYAMTGDDSTSFVIVDSTGQLQTSAPLDYEAASSYTFSLTVHDGKDATGNPSSAVDATIEVTVNVGNVNEAGTVSIVPGEVAVGGVVRARLVDPDGGVDEASVVWLWRTSATIDPYTWRDVTSRASGASLKVIEADQGKYIRAIARYDDAAGSDRARTETAGVVGASPSEPSLHVKNWVRGLSLPWDIAFTPDGTMLFNQRRGMLSARLPDGTIQAVEADFSDLLITPEGGVMGMVVDPDFPTNSRFFTCQTHDDPAQVQVVAWTINASYTAATRVKDPLFGGIPVWLYGIGCRLRFGPDGYLWVTTGDTTGDAPNSDAQDLNTLGGKVLRVDPDTGDGAPGNPFSENARVYTYGHRNAQGLTLRPGTREMWLVEHGPDFDDEINVLVAGGNYGWAPGDPYDRTVSMTDLQRFPDAQVAKWSSGFPTVATSGGVFLEGEWWGEYEGWLAVATLKNRTLRLFGFAEDGTLLRETVPGPVTAVDMRLRTAMMGPDNALYITTSHDSGADRILRVTPQQPPEFPEESRTVEVPEDMEISTALTTIKAFDPNYQLLVYSLGGEDAASFRVQGAGELYASQPLDYESESSFEVEVTARDTNAETDSILVTITVTNEDEAGTVSLTPSQPMPGNALVASLDDPDGGITNLDWQWERSQDRTAWTDVGDGSNSYTPSDEDGGYYLRATASYTDGHGAGKKAEAASANPVPTPPPPSETPPPPPDDTEPQIVPTPPADTATPSPSGGGGGGGDASADEPPPTASELFDDIEAGAWHEEAVTWMILHDITSGCAPTLFCPDANLTRQQFVTFLWRAAGRPPAPYLGSEAFADVRQGGYAEQSIGWAVANDVTRGCAPGEFGDPDRRFCPRQPVTRGQVATLLYRHVEADFIGTVPSHLDIDTDDFYAVSAAWLTHFQVVPGCAPDLFCPNREATRAEAALFIHGVAIRPHIWGPGNTSLIPN